jgi:hypothetical protein
VVTVVTVVLVVLVVPVVRAAALTVTAVSTARAAPAVQPGRRPTTPPGAWARCPRAGRNRRKPCRTPASA